MNRFVDFFALWLSINMIWWFTIWWTYDKNVTVDEEGHLLLQTSIAATAVTLAVWGVTRISRSGSAVPSRYASRVSAALDRELGVVEQAQGEAFDHHVEDHVVVDAVVSGAPEPDPGALQDVDVAR